jgi:hypothetical protein
MSCKVLKPEKFKVDAFTDKVPLEVMRSIWNDKENTYTDEQLLKMREWVYVLADVIFNASKKRRGNNIINLNPIKNETEESYPLHSGEYRRAS